MKCSIIKDRYDNKLLDIKEIERSVLFSAIKIAYKLDLRDEDFLYDSIYSSKYSPNNLNEKERQLKNYLVNLYNTSRQKIDFYPQGKGYVWVDINDNKLEDISYRYYFGLNPENMHKVVSLLTKAFMNFNVPVRFKFQQRAIYNKCDRIILYSDTKHKAQIEAVIKKVYDENKELFADSERAVSWLFESSIPNVYIAPELKEHNLSYGEKFANAIADTKKIFNYIYNVNDKNPKFVSRNANKEYDVINEIFMSILYRNGLLLDKQDNIIKTNEPNIRTQYDSKTGILKNYTDHGMKGYYDVYYKQTKEGKLSLIDNFYTVVNIKKHKDTFGRHLSMKDRFIEIQEYIRPYIKNNSVNKK